MIRSIYAVIFIFTELGAGSVFRRSGPIHAPDRTAAELFLKGILQHAAAFQADHTRTGTAAGTADSLPGVVKVFGLAEEG